MWERNWWKIILKKIRRWGKNRAQEKERDRKIIRKKKCWRRWRRTRERYRDDEDEEEKKEQESEDRNNKGNDGDGR